MQVKALKRFYDLQTKTLRLQNDEFTVDKKRFEQLCSASFVVLVPEVVEEQKPKRRKKAKTESGE